MDMWLEKDKWRKILYFACKVELILFIAIFLIAILYYNYEGAHEYFNRSSHIDIPWYQKEAITSIIASYTFAVSFSVMLIFPVVFLIQLFINIKLKIMTKRKIIGLIFIVLLYFSCIMSTFLFYSISLQQNIKHRHDELETLE